MKPEEYPSSAILSMTVYGESSNQPITGQILVCQTILNRVHRKTYFGKSIKEVCLKNKHFSCWNGHRTETPLDDDPNLQRMLEAWESCRAGTCTDKAMNQIRWVVAGCLNGDIIDISRGADHYHAKNVNPYWSRGKSPVLVVDDHVFYKLT